MTEQGNQTPYEIAISQFQNLATPYSPTKLLEGLTAVQTAGFTEGVEHSTLFSTLEDLAGTAANRASEIPDEEAAKKFIGMQQGYKRATDRITQPQTSTRGSRSRSGVAAG